MIFFTIFLLLSSTAEAITLEQALQKLNQNETWEKGANQVEQREAAVDIAQGSMLPTVLLKGALTKQDRVNNPLVKDLQRQIFLNLTQPLFQGMKALRSKQHAELVVKAQKAIQLAGQRELQFNLINHYFSIIGLQEELKLLGEAFDTALEVEKEMGRRARIGLNRKSDLLSVKAQGLRTQSQLQATQEQLKVATINFWRYLGEDIPEKESYVTPASKPQQPQVEFIYQNHPAVEASKVMLEASQAFTDIARSEHMPKLDFGFNYYVDQDGTFNQRTWDASVNLNFPIYAGGRTTAEVYRSQLLEKDAALNLIAAQRNLKETLHKLVGQYQSAQQRVKTLKESTDLAFKNYLELKRENQLGLITTLEVMNGLNLYLQDKRVLNQLTLDLLTYEYQLMALAGTI